MRTTEEFRDLDFPEGRDGRDEKGQEDADENEDGQDAAGEEEGLDRGLFDVSALLASHRPIKAFFLCGLYVKPGQTVNSLEVLVVGRLVLAFAHREEALALDDGLTLGADDPGQGLAASALGLPLVAM